MSQSGENVLWPHFKYFLEIMDIVFLGLQKTIQIFTISRFKSQGCFGAHDMGNSISDDTIMNEMPVYIQVLEQHTVCHHPDTHFLRESAAYSRRTMSSHIWCIRLRLPDWPACSPNLFPHVWCIVKCNIEQWKTSDCRATESYIGQDFNNYCLLFPNTQC